MNFEDGVRKTIQLFLKDPTLLIVSHFPDILQCEKKSGLEKAVACKKCVDSISGLCPGKNMTGRACIECILEHSLTPGSHPAYICKSDPNPQPATTKSGEQRGGRRRG